MLLRAIGLRSMANATKVKTHSRKLATENALTGGSDGSATFMTAHIVHAGLSLPSTAAEQSELTSAIGSMVHTGAPYSAIGFAWLSALSYFILHGWLGELEPVPAQFASCRRWKYGSGSHASTSRLMFGTMLIPARTPTGIVLRILHLVLDGWTHWGVGRNVTPKSHILLLDGCYIELQSPKGGSLHLSLI